MHGENFVPHYPRFCQMWRNLASHCNPLKMGVYFTMHQCSVSRSVTYTPQKPFRGQGNLCFTGISLNLDACFEWFTSVVDCRKKGQSEQKGAWF